jgi:hypothetical protein
MHTRVQTTLIIVLTFIIGILVGALATGTVREERRDRFREMRIEDRFHRHMERIIQPTNEQRAALESALSQRSEQIQLLRDKYQSEIFALYDSLDADFASILTEEQRARVQRELQRGPRRFTRRQIEWLTDELDLTSEQREEISQILLKMMPEPGHFRKPPEPGTRLERRQSFQKRFQAMEDELQGVLTPEQLQKYHALRAQRGMMFGREPDFRRPFEGRDRPPPRPFEP